MIYDHRKYNSPRNIFANKEQNTREREWKQRIYKKKKARNRNKKRKNCSRQRRQSAPIFLCGQNRNWRDRERDEREKKQQKGSFDMYRITEHDENNTKYTYTDIYMLLCLKKGRH